MGTPEWPPAAGAGTRSPFGLLEKLGVSLSQVMMGQGAAVRSGPSTQSRKIHGLELRLRPQWAGYFLDLCFSALSWTFPCSGAGPAPLGGTAGFLFCLWRKFVFCLWKARLVVLGDSRCWASPLPEARGGVSQPPSGCAQLGDCPLSMVKAVLVEVLDSGHSPAFPWTSRPVNTLRVRFPSRFYGLWCRILVGGRVVGAMGF